MTELNFTHSHGRILSLLKVSQAKNDGFEFMA